MGWIENSENDLLKQTVYRSITDLEFLMSERGKRDESEIKRWEIERQRDTDKERERKTNSDRNKQSKNVARRDRGIAR